jgi:hypothetical protein
VNANPSGSRTPSTGSWGRSKARKGFTKATGPSLCHAWADVYAGCSGGIDRHGKGTGGGTRHATKACRGALFVRRTAQGRTGDLLLRQVSRHLASHPLLLANTSAPADAVRPAVFDRANVRSVMALATAESAGTRQEAQRRTGSSLQHGAGDTELVQPGRDVATTAANGHSRGKGVLAA